MEPYRMHRVAKLEGDWEKPLSLDLMIADRGTYASVYESRHAVEHEDRQLWLVRLENLLEMRRESG